MAKLIGLSLRGGRNIAQVSAHVTATDLEFLSELIEAGKVRPHIDRRYRFTEISCSNHPPGIGPRQREGRRGPAVRIGRRSALLPDAQFLQRT